MVMTVHGSVAEQTVETPYPDWPGVVMKFGGRSVATAENWAKMNRLVQAQIRAGVVLESAGRSVATAVAWAKIVGDLQAGLEEGVVPVIVHSALAGVSNALIDLLETAERGGAVDEKLDKVKRQHLDLAA